MPQAPHINGPKPFIRFNKIVFVDPQDSNASYWWPAMVVPDKDLDKVKQFLDPKFELPKPGECLVCYFEDGSFSNVLELETLPFSPYREPYLSYSKGSHSLQFINDSSVRWATKYYQKGKFPKYFHWLKVLNDSINNPSPHPTPPYPSQLDKVTPKTRPSRAALPSPQSTLFRSEESNGRDPPPVNIKLELPPAVTSSNNNGNGSHEFKEAVQTLCQLRTTPPSDIESKTKGRLDYNNLQFRKLGILPTSKRQSCIKLLQERNL